MKTKNLILGIILAVIGLLMTIMPSACIKAVVVLVGLAAVALGGYNLFVVYKKIPVSDFKKTVLIKGIASIVIGLIAVICPFVLLKTVVSIWNIFSYILGAYLILFSVFGFYSGSKLPKENVEEKKRLTKESFTSLLIAVLLFIIPIEAVGKTFVRIIGIAGLAIGILLILIEIVISKRTTVVAASEVIITDDEEAETPEAEVESEEVPAEQETAEEEKSKETNNQ